MSRLANITENRESKRGLEKAAGCLGRLLLAIVAAALLCGNGLAAESAVQTSRARVVVVQDRDATSAFTPRPSIIRSMINRGVMRLSGKSLPTEAWRSLLSTNGVVSTNEVIGIKVCSAPGPNSGTRPAVLEGVIEGLLAAGVSPRQIVIWDKHLTDLRLAGFFDLAKRFGVRTASSTEGGYDEKVFYESPVIGNLVWGDFEFGKTGGLTGRKSFVSRLITRDLTLIINVTPMLNHNEAGVTGCLYGLAAAGVDNFMRFESDAERLATAVPEIWALPEINTRVVLNIVDALVCQYEGGEKGLLHYSATLNELRFSRDPVALDVLSLKELDRQRRAANAPTPKLNLELYNNAALLELGVSDPRNIERDTPR